jgi:alkylation response protein AidB-like acyl-CoA dehydrogenase
MTFDLTPSQLELVSRARDLASLIDPQTAALADTQGTMPPHILDALAGDGWTDVFAHGAVAAVAIVEAVATESAGVGAALGFASAAGQGTQPPVSSTDAAPPPALPGLRGSELVLAAAARSGPAATDRARLMAAAVALGVGRAAVAHTVAAMKKLAVRPGPDEETPHWALADGAAAVEAARLLTYDAAQRLESGAGAGTAVARSKALAASAARTAVEAAIRIEGPGGYVRGGVLERLTRDALTLAIILPVVAVPSDGVTG